MNMEAFFTVHSELPREGPGTPDDVLWALNLTKIGGAVRVCDAGCGPGADTETLAKSLPEAQIDAIDLHAPFAQAAKIRCAAFGSRVNAQPGDMSKLTGPYDFIWCAGALYFLGVTAGLKAWRPALSENAKVAFSEPVLLSQQEPKTVQDFWQEYPAITDRDGIAARVAEAGYKVLGERLIIGAPWEAYYVPMEARIQTLRETEQSPGIEQAITESEQEIVMWRAARDRIAYQLTVVAPE